MSLSSARMGLLFLYRNAASGHHGMNSSRLLSNEICGSKSWTWRGSEVDVFLILKQEDVNKEDALPKRWNLSQLRAQSLRPFNGCFTNEKFKYDNLGNANRLDATCSPFSLQESDSKGKRKITGDNAQW